MLFTSYSFIGFLAVVLVAYYIIPKRFQWMLLLLASYVFYLFAGAEYLVYIIATTVTVFIAGVCIDNNFTRQSGYLKTHKEELSKDEKKAYKAKQKKTRLYWLVGCVIFNLGILAVLKYTDFVISNINGVLSAFGQTGEISFLSLALPMGISFYTFQAVGYLVDVYRGGVKAERNLFKFALFVSFFPQLIQGPISRFGDLSKTLYGEHSFESGTVCRGLQRVLWGYFKKMVIADRVLVGVNTLIADTGTYQGAYVVLVMLLYTLELYSDFTGGIDITIGIAESLGIKVEENFNRPYFSKSLKEYWRRWHISMGSWFRDYIFYPLSVSRPVQSLSKFTRNHFGIAVGKRIPVYFCMLVTWFATGIWHGASWNFIVWGLSNCVILMVSEELEPLYEKFHERFPATRGRVYQAFEVLRTFSLICLLHLFDCYSVSNAFKMFASIFTVHNWSILFDGSVLDLGLSALDFGILAAGVVIMLSVSLLQRRESVRDRISRRPYPVRFVVWYGLFLVVLLMGAYGIGYDASQFIYNQF